MEDYFVKQRPRVSQDIKRMREEKGGSQLIVQTYIYCLKCLAGITAFLFHACYNYLLMFIVVNIAYQLESEFLNLLYFYFRAITLSFTFHLLLFAIFFFFFLFFLSFRIHIIVIFFFLSWLMLKMQRVKGVSKAMDLHNSMINLIFELLGSIFTRLDKVHLRVLSCLLTNKLSN